MRRIIITESQLNAITEGGDYNIHGVYHVSSANFEEFRIGEFETGEKTFPYLFFSSKPIVLYGANIVYECNLSIHNPLVFEGAMSWSYPLWLYLSDGDGHLIPEEEFTPEKYDGYLGCPFELWKQVYYDDTEYELDQLPELVRDLNKGYDGVIIKAIDEGDTSLMVDDYIVFEPSQVQIVKKYRRGSHMNENGNNCKRLNEMLNELSPELLGHAADKSRDMNRNKQADNLETGAVDALNDELNPGGADQNIRYSLKSVAWVTPDKWSCVLCTDGAYRTSHLYGRGCTTHGNLSGYKNIPKEMKTDASQARKIIGWWKRFGEKDLPLLNDWHNMVDYNTNENIKGSKVLKEDSVSQSADNKPEGKQEGIGYSIDTFVSDKEMSGYDNYVIPRITASLTGLKSMCDKYNIDFEWEITRVEKTSSNKKSGWKITANAAMPELRVEGYTYVGSVVPLVDDYALVVPSKDFKGNFEVLDKIKSTVSREKCAGCNRVAERGVYYVFKEDATGELKKFGSTCARKYLGISVNASINQVFTYLYNILNSENIYSFDPDGSYGGRGGDWRPRGYDQVAAACAYLALFGIPEARFSFKYCSEYDQLVTYYQTIDNRETAYPTFYKEVERNHTRIDSFISQFYSGIFDFSRKMNPQSDFDDAIKTHGLYLGGTHVTKGGERRFRLGIYPYVVLKYFQGKRDEGVEVTAVEEFFGTKEFSVTILNKEQKRSIEGNGVYLQVYAKTDNNEYLAWYQNEDNPSLGINKKIVIYGEYGGENGKYCMLRRVKIMGDEEIQQRNERQAISYPENGTRLRNVQMTVVRAKASYVIFRDENGCEYFVSNATKDRWGEVTGIKYPEWEQIFKPGCSIRLTGTVDSYVDRYGETKHTLKRVVYDETSFPEIDWSQYDIDELIHDRHKILVDGKAVDIYYVSSLEGKYIVRLSYDDYDTYSVYDKKEQKILFTGTWDECEDFIINGNSSVNQNLGTPNNASQSAFAQVSEGTRKPLKKIHLTESDIASMVESVLREIGNLSKGQRALHALAARQQNKAEKLYRMGKDDAKMSRKSQDTINYAHQAAMDKIHSGENLEPDFADAGFKAFYDYKKSHKPEDEKIRPSDEKTD